MKSLYLKVLVWSIVTVVVAMTGLMLHSRLTMRRGGPGFPTGRILADVARRIQKEGGVEALRAFVAKASADTASTFYVTDGTGRDLLTGEDRSALLAPPGPPPSRFFPFAPPPPRTAFAMPSSDGEIQWIHVFGGDLGDRPSPAEAFVWILAAVSLLAYLFTFYLVSPLRKLGSVVERFGSGDLTARARTNRRDELGNLARAFDEMAERIDTLVTAERRLLQDISHELRTPLARMRFAVEIARTDPNQKEALDRIRKECDRLALLTDELLESSVAGGDPEGRQLELDDVSTLLEEITADASLEAAQRRIRIHLSAPEDVRLRMDRELLRRAIDNVLRNAIRYSPDDEAIDVTLSVAPAAVDITIRDRGPGVGSEMLDKIFQPFFRAESHRARAADSGGVGLGLAIARRAVQRHHGAIKAENVAPGLCVVLTLPAAP